MSLISYYFIDEDLEMLSKLFFKGFGNEMGLIFYVVGVVSVDLKNYVLDYFYFELFE